MSLRSKILFFVLAISAAFTLTSWLVQKAIVLPEFVQLERREATADLARVTRALLSDAEFVATTAQDYAAWDDTYRYVADGNPGYERAMLIPETYTSLGIQMLLVVASDGSVRWGRIVDAEGRELPGADAVIAQIARQVQAFAAVLELARAYGIHLVAEGVETEDQLALLRRLEVDQAQGYLLGRPLTAEDAEGVIVRGLGACAGK